LPNLCQIHFELVEGTQVLDMGLYAQIHPRGRTTCCIQVCS
jgi:hypothetical protein